MLANRNDLDYIVLNSENFENFQIPREQIKDLSINDVTMRLSLNGDQVVREYTCQYASFEFNLNFLKQVQTEAGNLNGHQYSLDERLCYMPDIVDVVMKGGDTYDVFLPWASDDYDDINKSIESWINPEEGLFRIEVQ